MRNTRIILLLLGAAIFALCSPAVLQAAPVEGSSFFQSISPVSFYIVDDASPVNSATLSISNYPPHAPLSYSYDNTIWHPWSAASIDISFDNNNNFKKIFLQIGDPPTDTDADLEFTSYSGTAGTFDCYTGLIINWGMNQLSFATTSDHKFAPVPIPASVLLLGAGLLGIVGFRRRSAMK